MDKIQKFDLIINAILEARKKCRDSLVMLELSIPEMPSDLSALEIAKWLQTQPKINPSINTEGKLQGLSRSEVLGILEEFQREEKVIELSQVNRPFNQRGQKTIAYGIKDPKTGKQAWMPAEEFSKKAVLSSTGYPADDFLRDKIGLSILPGFDNWHFAYLLGKKDDLSNLSFVNLSKICHTVLDIDDKLQIDPGPDVEITPDLQNFSHSLGSQFNPFEYREEALMYLKRIGIIKSFDPSRLKSLEFAGPILGQNVRVYVNIQRFNEFKPKVIEAYKAREALAAVKQGKPASGRDDGSVKRDKEVIYEVRFTQSREILINDFLLTKLDFDRENDLVFDYLYQNPNKTISTTELEKPLGGTPLKKPLHKIVENLGFTRELKKVFFNISKDSIRFRNPIRKSELQDMKIDWLRFPRP